MAEAQAAKPAAQTGASVDVSDAAKPAKPAKPAAKPAEVTPEHEMSEADGMLTLKVKLPELASLAEAEVDISDEAFRLYAPGHYSLSLEWPRSGASDDAKARFLKKSRTLTLTMPLVV